MEKISSNYKGPSEHKIKFEEEVGPLLKNTSKIKDIVTEHCIKLTNDAAIIKSYTPRSTPKDKEFFEEKIADLQEKGYICESNSTFASPLVLVKKKNGSTRICVDYSQLNKITIKDQFPIPLINDTLDTLQNARWFTKLDLTNGYWQIPVRKEDRWKTAFKTHRGLYQWNVMPFGLCNAPATFQRTMNNLLRNYNAKFTMCYLDDIIVFSKDITTHTDLYVRYLL